MLIELCDYDNDIGRNKNVFLIWVSLLMKASYKEETIIHNGKKRTFPPGTVTFTYSELSNKWGLSKSTINRCLKYLESTGRIKNDVGSLGTVVTICNWYELQRFENRSDLYVNDKETPGVHTTGPRSTQHEETTNARLSSCVTSKIFSLGQNNPFNLDALYIAYPRHIGRKIGLKRLGDMVKSQETYDQLKLAIYNYSEYIKKNKTEPRFIKHFPTFLSEWEDWVHPEVEEKKLSIDFQE